MNVSFLDGDLDERREMGPDTDPIPVAVWGAGLRATATPRSCVG